jgi:hypothetical protein
MKEDNGTEGGWNDEEFEEYGEYDDKPNEEDSGENRPVSEKKGNRKLLTSIQVYGCLIILAAAVILRMSGTDLFSKVRSWYLDALNDSIVADEQIDQAKHTVVGLWTNLASAGSKLSSGSQSASGTSAQSSQASVPESSVRKAESGGKAAASSPNGP